MGMTTLLSQDSPHFANEARKQQQTDKRVAALRAQAAALSPNTIARLAEGADQRISQLEMSRDLSRIWLHCDMDAFFAACEEQADPSLKDKPMVRTGQC